MVPPRIAGRTVAGALGLALLSPALVVSPPASTAPAALEHERPSAQRVEARGVGAWRAPGIGRSLRRSHAAWVYNWGPAPTFPVPHGVQFVPMIWGAAFLTPQNLALAKTHGPDLLTFNEPELGSQANLSVAEAVRLWPALEATGMRLSSPAVTGDARDRHGWLGRFMRKAERRGLRVDFLALHWYAGKVRPETVDHLRRYLTEMHRKYHRPIWLTEFAIVAHDGYGRLIYPSQRVQASFAAQATRMLDRLPFVERYAWFALSAPANGRSSGLYRPDSTATAAGRAYRH